MLAERFARDSGMWTDENRARYDRSKLRYPIDLTDEEWSLIQPLIPPAKRGRVAGSDLRLSARHRTITLL